MITIYYNDNYNNNNNNYYYYYYTTTMGLRVVFVHKAAERMRSTVSHPATLYTKFQYL